MWLSLILFVAVLFMLIAGVLAGGIFTIILLPLAAVALLSAVAVGLILREARDATTMTTDDAAGERSAADEIGPHGNALPRSHRGTGAPDQHASA